MLELIPCMLGALVSFASAPRAGARASLVLASLTGAAVAVVRRQKANP